MRLALIDPKTSFSTQNRRLLDLLSTNEAFCSLDETCERLRAGAGIPGALEALIRSLGGLRSAMSHDEWRLFAREAAAMHPIRDILHQDPFTRRSFEKPRGYAGDAVMIDYIYGYARLNGTSNLGRAVMECTTNTVTARAVRCRREVFARIVDEVAAQRPLPRILALACGHLREAYLSTAVRERRIGEYIALDQDPESLSVVDQTFGRQGVRTVQASVLDLTASDPSHAPHGAGGGDAAGARIPSRTYERRESIPADNRDGNPAERGAEKGSPAQWVNEGSLVRESLLAPRDGANPFAQTHLRDRNPASSSVEMGISTQPLAKGERGFDLIYAAGLYDYLWRGAAKELTAYAFNMLDPGGRLVIANVLPDIPDVGYMEAIMDWWLIYRTADQLAAVADSIPRANIANLHTFTDPNNCIVFLELARA